MVQFHMTEFEMSNDFAAVLEKSAMVRRLWWTATDSP
jgi:hypothetical protein